MEEKTIYMQSAVVRNIALDEGEPSKDLVIKQMAVDIIRNMRTDDLLKLFTLREFREDNFSWPHENRLTHFELKIKV